LREQEEMVQKFFEKQGIKAEPIDQDGIFYIRSHLEHARGTKERLLIVNRFIKDWRINRLSVILSEVVELYEAICDESRTKIADAIGDLLYSLIGTAVLYDMPTTEIFQEVHKSNLSKEKSYFQTGEKGCSYFPPNLSFVEDEESE
jgi:phosphoribosyl-ATP pyrophosphohydrolase